ncbi:MAG: glycosyltransferase [Candidatus Micrarchaeaceae archaeon]
MKPDISVIIPALDEQKYIHYSLSGLKAQTFKNFEVIVVDGGSEDRTASIAKRSAKVIVCRKRGAGSARNKGAEKAKGSILVFIDADTRPSNCLLEAYMAAFLDNGTVAATGPILPLEKTGMRIRAGYWIVSVVFVRLSILFNRPSIVGSNFAVRSTAFRKSGGFNEKFITYEDWDLSNRLGKLGRIRYENRAEVCTSARRVIAWGLLGYVLFYAINMFMYHVLRKSNSDYKSIR